MTRRAGLPRFSALSVRRGDAGQRKARETPSESLGKPPLRSAMRPVGGRRKVLAMRRIAGDCPPARRAADGTSMSHDQRSLILCIRRLPARVASLPVECMPWRRTASPARPRPRQNAYRPGLRRMKATNSSSRALHRRLKISVSTLTYKLGAFSRRHSFLLVSP